MQFSRPTSSGICRIASRKGRLSMSPTVPPISVITTSVSASASCLTTSLISLVMWGITCTVLPRNSPRRSLVITER